ncbi:hypothetical protein SRAA_2303 [Serpentinimonas raichei]|jgi:hypothetical protein|uniref:DUF721 domain-containing protein n=1 Tax=Serpentinimonas raichei TaxID=1458425 RepID=A0A060NKC5_9BURK|nr:DciA family protein [Serpentinimonas raichei]BAO82157.1 hypothetical protein SRAA_2303 [Serpentinimonas raichei]
MIPLEQAVRASTVLSAITQRVAQSQQLLQLTLPLLPPTLRDQVAAGPLDDGVWCVLVNNPAASSKLRQLAPTLLQALQSSGQPVASLRIKVRQHAAG